MKLDPLVVRSQICLFFVRLTMWRPGGITIDKRVCVPYIQHELFCHWDWTSRGQQLAQSARGMTLSASVGNGQITETATRVPALSSRTPVVTFCFQIQPDFVMIQSVVMPISRTDPYGSNSGAFFECCQQNKNKCNEDEINKLAVCVE
jgi:hypothetical protein